MREMTPRDLPGGHKRFLKQMKEECGPLGAWKLEMPGDPAVTLHSIPATDEAPVQTLFTVGLSDRTLPRGQHDQACTELKCLLPAAWPLDDKALKEPRWNWPVEWMKRVVNELRGMKEWPGEPAVFANGDPPASLGPGTQLCAWLCATALTGSVQAPDYRWIDVHLLVPVYAEEAALARKQGDQALLERFQEREIPEFIVPDRPNVAVG
jgi:hypothetical protein